MPAAQFATTVCCVQLAQQIYTYVQLAIRSALVGSATVVDIYAHRGLISLLPSGALSCKARLFIFPPVCSAAVPSTQLKHPRPRLSPPKHLHDFSRRQNSTQCKSANNCELIVMTKKKKKTLSILALPTVIVSRDMHAASASNPQLADHLCGLFRVRCLSGQKDSHSDTRLHGGRCSHVDGMMAAGSSHDSKK
jgi:hypothetical protein